MDVIDYLNKYHDKSFKEMSFNEVDALVMAMISYVDFNELKVDKKKIKGVDLLKYLDAYVPSRNDSERKLKYIKVLSLVCKSKRYDKVIFFDFKKVRDKVTDKQFQAVTIILKDFIYISYCGTDATVLGWKEDLNMAILEIVPSEIEAIKYANEIASKIWFKKIYLGGHSKGGRLAITAAKGLNNKKRLGAIFAFDAPNYPSSCYDANYKKIDNYIISYAPNESIIGRIMSEYHQKRIIKSSNKLLMQHDAFSWLIEDRSFVYESDYTEHSNKIVNTINHALNNYDEEKKRQFIDAIFDYLDRLGVDKLPGEKELIPFAIRKLPLLISEWKNTSREDRSAIKKIAFELVKDYFLIN